MTELTPEEALRIVLKQRENRRKPEAKANQRKYRRDYQRRLVAGYAAAKKAGLVK